MPKVKPTWVCQHCERQFTTKYSLMRHFRRFPQHSPPHLSPGDSDVKAITVEVNEHIRTVTAIPLNMVPSSVSHEHGTRYKQHKHHQDEDDDENDDHDMVDSRSVSKKNRGASSSKKARMTHPGATFSLRNVSDTEESPSSTEFEYKETHDTDEVCTGKKDFPFLPPFLEDEQILDIATPQHSSHSPLDSSGSTSDPIRLLSSPLSVHYSWAFATNDAATPEPGQVLLSPLTPACAATNFRQVFHEEEEKLKALTTACKFRSPVELSVLDRSLLLGDEEATSPFTFLEKTASHEPILPLATSLDFLSPPYRNESSSLSSAHEVSMDDLDLGRFYAPIV